MLNRQLRISMEKPATATDSTPRPRFNREELEANINFVKSNLKELAIGGVGIYTAVKVVSTLSEIAINIAPKR